MVLLYLLLDSSQIILLSKSEHIDQSLLKKSLSDYDGIPCRVCLLMMSKVPLLINLLVKRANVSRQCFNGVAVNIVERQAVAVAKDGQGFVSCLILMVLSCRI